jgi:WD40 repeat protein
VSASDKSESRCATDVRSEAAGSDRLDSDSVGSEMAGQGAQRARWVWDTGTGACDATLIGHSGMVSDLFKLVHGNRLFSGSRDRSIRALALGTWVALRTV